MARGIERLVAGVALAAAVAVYGSPAARGDPNPEVSVEPEAKHVPTRLFEIELGNTYRFRERNFTKSDLPVARATGVQKGLGTGIHVFFQPQKKYEAFPYIEKRKKRTDKYYESSFHVYLIPVLPEGAKTFKEVDDQPDPAYEVLRIDWSQLRDIKEVAKRQKDYSWTLSMCKTFEADLGIKPVVVDNDSVIKFYRCTFAEGSRRLVVDSYLGRSVMLEYADEVSDAKRGVIDMRLRKMEASEIRPY